MSPRMAVFPEIEDFDAVDEEAGAVVVVNAHLVDAGKQIGLGGGDQSEVIGRGFRRRLAGPDEVQARRPEDVHRFACGEFIHAADKGRHSSASASRSRI